MVNDRFTADKFNWLEQVAHDPGLRHSSVRISVVLASYLNREKGCAWPSVATLGDDTGLSRRAVQVALDDLIQRGHLDRKTGGGRAKSSRFFPILGGEKQRTGVRGNDAETAHKNSRNRARFDKKQRTGVRRNPFYNPMNEPTDENAWDGKNDNTNTSAESDGRAQAEPPPPFDAESELQDCCETIESFNGKRIEGLSAIIARHTCDRLKRIADDPTIAADVRDAARERLSTLDVMLARAAT